MKHSQSRLPWAIFLMGPTATGKTDLAVALREHLPVELISVDSALIYRGMDIGTAKPDRETLRKAPHRMIDICDPAEPFSVADFLSLAKGHMQEISASGRIPLLVGGTMLYFRALLDGLADIPAVAREVREQIEKEASQSGWPALYRELQAVDPETAAGIHPNHSRRIQRALEVYRATGKTMAFYRKVQAGNTSDYQPVTGAYQVIQIGLLAHQRELLHQRIGQRFDAMLEQGFEAEVKKLMARSELHADLPSLRAVGYRQMWQYLQGEWSYPEMVEKGKAATRQLAKRQLTWMRKWSELNRIFIDKDNGDPKIKQQLLEEALKILSVIPIYSGMKGHYD